MPAPVSLVIFDLDGVLIDFDPAARLRETVAMTGLEAAAIRAAMRERPDVLAFVREVATRVSVALLTNQGPLLREALPELAPGVCDAVGERLHATCEFGARKPDPAVFTRVLARHGVAPAHAAFVDDSPRNVEGARTAGLHALLYRDLPTLRQELTPLLP